MKAFLFDTETTGLIQNHTLKLDKQPHIIEFYGCHADIKTGKVVSELDLLIKPPVKIDDEITGITGITDDDVRNAPAFEAVSGRIFGELENAPLIIAHNASYDQEMIDLEAERLKRKIRWPRLLCTVEQTIAIKGFRLNLSGLHEHLFGEPHKGAHRAKADVMALLRCCKELVKREIL